MSIMSNLLFLKAFESNPCPMAITEVTSGKYIQVNNAFLTTLNYYKDEVIGKTSLELGIFADINERQKAIDAMNKHGNLRDFTASINCKNSNTIIGLFNGEFIEIQSETYLLTVMSDITAKIQLEKEIIRLEKLNLIGELSAGISHEVRNPMTTVKGFLQMFMKKSEYAHHKEYLELMISELDRANTILTDFLSIAKSNPLHPEYAMQNLTEIINKIKPLIEAEAFETGNQLYSSLSEIPPIVINEKEIRQLLLNLVHNGFDAMPEGGILTIKTFRQDNQVVLAVQDQGKGIEKSIIEKLGTPFFTTKDNGTGLGLAVCFGIAHRHNATINIDTGSSGTTFCVHFPIPIMNN